MTTSPSFEEFKKGYQKKVPQLFSKLDLSSKIDTDTVYNLPLLIYEQITLAQEQLLKIRNKDKIKEIYLIFCYFAYSLYLDSKDEDDVNQIWDDHLLFDDFLHVTLSHIVFSRDDKKNYANQFNSDQNFAAISDKTNKFINLLKEANFDFEKSTFAVIFTVLIWVKLEKIIELHEENLVVIKIENHTIYHLANPDPIASVIVQQKVTSLLIDCVKCAHLFERYEKMIKYGNSEPAKIFKSKVRKETSKKGGKSKGENGQEVLKITRFFWEKCCKEKPNISKKTFSEALCYAFESEENKAPRGDLEKIRSFIKSLNEQEKIEILKRSNAKPRAIAARLSGLKK